MHHTPVSPRQPMFAYLLTLGTSLVACASVPLNTESSTSQIRAAEEMGAEDVPEAALHLHLAKEHLADARRLSKDGDDKEAESMLMRAQVDAELALALARNEKQKTAAQVELDTLQKLRDDNSGLLDSDSDAKSERKTQ